MNKKTLNLIAEIRDAAVLGIREGYLHPSGVPTLPNQDIQVLLRRIDELEDYIVHEADRTNMCTFHIFGKICDRCQCHRKNKKI